MKLYDLVKDLLTTYPKLRDSDKLLIWNVWGALGRVEGSYILRSQFMAAPTPETITRCRRKIQEKHPELSSTPAIKAVKDQKEATKGTFIYHEAIQEKLLD